MGYVNLRPNDEVIIEANILASHMVMELNREPPHQWLVDMNPYLNDVHQRVLTRLKLMVIPKL